MQAFGEIDPARIEQLFIGIVPHSAHHADEARVRVVIGGRKRSFGGGVAVSSWLSRLMRCTGVHRCCVKFRRTLNQSGATLSFNLVQGITFAIAILGAVLGVLNTWFALDRSRLKLRVTPKHAIPFGNVPPNLKFCVEVQNLSDFAVTIEEVGVFYSGTKKRGAIFPFLIDDKQWPRRLEARSSVTVYSERPSALLGGRIRCAYAKTACGRTKTGMSGALSEIARENV
jgi:hypothetical protein